MISASSGLLVLVLSGSSLEQAWPAALNWFFGYGVGLLVVAPLLIVWWPQRRATPYHINYFHFAICMGLTATAAAYLFLSPSQVFLRPWHLFPFLVWAAVAFQVRGAASALAVISIFAVSGAIQGTGPLASADLTVQVSTLLTQQFVGMIGATILLLAAAVDERRDVEAAARLAAIVQSAPEAMVSYDANGRISTWNRGAELLFDYPEAEVLGRGGELLLPPEKPEGLAGIFGLAIHAGGPIHIETVRVSRSGKRVDVAVSASPMFDPAGRFIGVAAVMRDISARKKVEAQQRLLIGELNHRVKNTLAVIQGLAQQTFKAVVGADEAKAAFEGRLLALASAHDVLTERSWENASFRKIVEASLRPFTATGGGQILVAGDDFMVRPQAALSFAMVLHELATNAVKYGALRSSAGRVEIVWSTEDNRFDFLWAELNAQPLAVPRSRGFGSRLIERTLRSEISGEITMDYTPTGLSFRVSAPNFRAYDDFQSTNIDEQLPLNPASVTVAF
jgi:PAS domain S-box-containing protein